MAPILKLLLIAFVVSYVIWFVDRRFLGKQISFNKLMLFGLLAAFSVFTVLYSLELLVAGF
ncbi:MAG: hypothetical protein AAEF23_07370 [Gammaproteobacteria bacterium]|jgi:hypothetical protein